MISGDDLGSQYNLYCVNLRSRKCGKIYLTNYHKLEPHENLQEIVLKNKQLLDLNTKVMEKKLNQIAKALDTIEDFYPVTSNEEFVEVLREQAFKLAEVEDALLKKGILPNLKFVIASQEIIDYMTLLN